MCAKSYALATTSPHIFDLLITEVQTRDAASSYDEFIAVSNNSFASLDISNWCLKYISTGGSSKILSCFTPPDVNSYYILPKNGTAVVASSQEMAALPVGTPVDGTFAGTLSNDAGSVEWVDTTGKNGDIVDWGPTALYGYADVIPAGDVIKRVPVPDASSRPFQDTNSLSDFALTAYDGFPASSLTLIHDLCLNLAGVQTEIPPGDSVDGQGNCSQVVDVCLNLDGLRAELPPGLTLDDAGNCLQDETPPPDEAPTDGADSTGEPPSDDTGDTSDADTSGDVDTNPGDDTPPAAAIVTPFVTELLPNPTGDDKGREYIEIYNPNDVALDLSTYSLKIGAALGTKVTIPTGTMITANSYLALYNSTLSFTLVNSSGVAGIDGSSASDVYNAAPDGEA